MLDFQKLAEEILTLVKGYVSGVREALEKRIEEVQKSIPEPVQIDVDAIAKSAAALVEVPVPENGKDAEPIDMAEVISHVDQAIEKAVAALPAPEPGKDAEPIDRDALLQDLAKMFRQPEDGKSITVEDIMPVLEKMQSAWALEWERRAYDLLQKAVDRIPKPKDGVDGFGFDDMTVEHDGERALTIKFAQGEREKRFDFTLPIILDRGVFREGSDYLKSDGVTFGGSFFIAQTDAPQGKPGESDDWRLVVKRGRDGKNYEPRETKTTSVKL